ncbi:MAG: hypothetical protein J6Z22_07880 [Lachnospiraceae bacterium]|nr:hypothetical protein [Lachnospiraceae bacterium]
MKNEMEIGSNLMWFGLFLLLKTGSGNIDTMVALCIKMNYNGAVAV